MNTEIYMGEDPEDRILKSIWKQLHANCADLKYVVVVLKMTFNSQTERNNYRSFASNLYNNINLESRRIGIKSNDILGDNKAVAAVTYKDTATEMVRAYMFAPIWNNNTIKDGTTYGANKIIQLVVNNVNYVSGSTFQGEVQLLDGTIKSNSFNAENLPEYVYFSRASASSSYCNITPFTIKLNNTNNPLVLGMVTRLACLPSVGKFYDLTDSIVATYLLYDKYINITFSPDSQYMISRLDNILANYDKWIVPFNIRFGEDRFFTRTIADTKMEVDWALDRRVVIDGTPPKYYNINGGTSLNINIQIILKHGVSLLRLPLKFALCDTYRTYDYQGRMEVEFFTPYMDVKDYATTSKSERIKIGVGYMDAIIYTNSEQLITQQWQTELANITYKINDLKLYVCDNYQYSILPFSIQDNVTLYRAINKLPVVKEIAGTLDRPIFAMYTANEDLEITYINNENNNRLTAPIYGATSTADIARLTPDLRDILSKDIWATRQTEIFCQYTQGSESSYPTGEVLNVIVSGRAVLPPPTYLKIDNCKAYNLAQEVAVIPQMLAVKNATYCLPIINGHNIKRIQDGEAVNYNVHDKISPDCDMPYYCEHVNFNYNAIRNYAFLSNIWETPKKITLQTECPDIAELIFTLPAEEGVFVATNDGIHTQLYMECVDNYFDRQQTAISRKYNLGEDYYETIKSNDIESVKVVHKVTLRLKDLNNISVWYYQWLFTNVEVVAMRIIYADNANIIAPSAEINEYSPITPMPHFRYNVAKVTANNAILEESNGEIIVYLERVVANLN